MHIDKAEIIATLRARGLDAKADWVDRELPEIVDTVSNRSSSDLSTRRSGKWPIS